MSNGVRFSFIKNSKFKTSMIGVYFSTPLTAEKVSINALVPAVLIVLGAVLYFSVFHNAFLLKTNRLRRLCDAAAVFLRQRRTP